MEPIFRRRGYSITYLKARDSLCNIKNDASDPPCYHPILVNHRFRTIPSRSFAYARPRDLFRCDGATGRPSVGIEACVVLGPPCAAHAPILSGFVALTDGTKDGKFPAAARRRSLATYTAWLALGLCAGHRCRLRLYNVPCIHNRRPREADKISVR